MNAFNPKKRATFNVTYGLDCTELRNEFDRVASPKEFTKTTQEQTANRIYSLEHEGSKRGQTIPEIRAKLEGEDMGVNHNNYLLVYWGKHITNMDCFARLFNDDTAVMQDKNQIPWSFDILSLDSLLRQTSNLQLYKLQVAYRCTRPNIRLRGGHFAETDTLATLRMFQDHYEVLDTYDQIVEANSDMFPSLRDGLDCLARLQAEPRTVMPTPGDCPSSIVLENIPYLACIDCSRYDLHM
jgi:hypothetical protein